MLHISGKIFNSFYLKNIGFLKFSPSKKIDECTPYVKKHLLPFSQRRYSSMSDSDFFPVAG